MQIYGELANPLLCCGVVFVYKMLVLVKKAFPMERRYNIGRTLISTNYMSFLH